MQSARRPRRRWLRLGLPRARAAVRLIAAVMHKRHSLDDALAKEFASDALAPRDRALARLIAEPCCATPAS